jgi:hypothetical protein
MQIEQIWMQLEQPEIRFKTKWKIWMIFEPELKKFKWLLQISKDLKKFLESGISYPNQDL